MKILAIESSCDETSAAVVENGTKVLSCAVRSQIKTHAKFGGVVPEIAARDHVLAINFVVDQALKDANVGLKEIDTIAVTQGPGLIGALFVGINAAQSLALALDKPLIGVNHLVGHAYAAAIGKELKFPCLVLLVSGGHTELLILRSHLEFEHIGQTLDDAVGECYDKVARVLGFPYPGGKTIDDLAQTGNPEAFSFPRPILKQGFNFSFSGLKSAVINAYAKIEDKANLNKADFAASFQKAVLDTIIYKTKKALKKYPDLKQLIVGGGVSANKGLRAALAKEIKGVEVLIPEFKYCTDNAAMIGAAAYFQVTKFGANEDLRLKGYSVNNL